MPSSGYCEHCSHMVHIHMYRHIHIHKIKINLKKISIRGLGYGSVAELCLVYTQYTKPLVPPSALWGRGKFPPITTMQALAIPSGYTTTHPNVFLALPAPQCYLLRETIPAQPTPISQQCVYDSPAVILYLLWWPQIAFCSRAGAGPAPGALRRTWVCCSHSNPLFL